MRWLRMTVMLATCAAASATQANDIIDVLHQSAQRRLDAMTLAPDGPRAQAVRATFEMLRRTVAADTVVELRVVTGATVAETLDGRVIVANEALADVPEGVRVFVLAHELGHVQQGHWRQVGDLYKRFVPGEVVPQTTDRVAGPLGRAASAQAHRHEFEADAFALRALRTMGRTSDEAFAALRHQGMQQDSATHPATRKRLASLRAADAGEAPEVAATETE
jgi:Zn-dependent protease with chaperone function